ncbi:MAG: helix-turn-helix domain-containing protein [Fluviibacter sp.]
MSLYTNLCTNLRAAIAAKNCSQGWLAEQSGYSVSYIQRVLQGVQTNPTLSFVECVAKALDTTPIALLQPVIEP